MFIVNKVILSYLRFSSVAAATGRPSDQPPVIIITALLVTTAQ